MCPQTKKGTDLDKSVLAQLAPFSSHQKDSLGDYHLKLKKAKSDISGLSTNQLLRKDYKEDCRGGFRFGISSVGGISAKKMCSEDNACKDEIYKFMKDLNLNAYLIMFSFTSSEGDFKRDLCVVGDSLELERDLSTYLNNCTKPWFGFEKVDYSGGEGLSLYSQREVHLSRKQVMPAVVDCFSSRFKPQSL